MIDLTGVIIAAVIVGGTGLFIGAFLGIAAEKFKVETDEREDAILEVLPGNNCGGCGYAGCAGLATAIVKGEAEVNACPVGGSPVAAQIGVIMGKEAKATQRKVAFVKCAGNCKETKQNYNYYGVEDCVMMEYVPDGGPKACNYGCMGFGSCVKACQFDAIKIIDGIAVVDKEACKACGKCIEICPKKLIEFVPYESKHLVQCVSKAKGKEVMEVCSVGCIGCKLCEKACEDDAVHVDDNIAYIDTTKCTNCGKCAEVCPKKIIL